MGLKPRKMPTFLEPVSRVEVHPGEILWFDFICEGSSIKLENKDFFLSFCSGAPHARVTPEVADNIGAQLGTGAQYWMNLQSSYDAAVAERHA